MLRALQGWAGSNVPGCLRALGAKHELRLKTVERCSRPRPYAHVSRWALGCARIGLQALTALPLGHVRASTPSRLVPDAPWTIPGQRPRPGPRPWACARRRRRPFPGFGVDFAPILNDRAIGRPTALLPAVWRKSLARIVQRPRLVDMAKLAEARRKSRTAAMICGDVCRCADAHGVAPRGAKVFGGLRRPAEASQTATEPRRTSWT